MTECPADGECRPSANGLTRRLGVDAAFPASIGCPADPSPLIAPGRFPASMRLLISRIALPLLLPLVLAGGGCATAVKGTAPGAPEPAGAVTPAPPLDAALPPLPSGSPAPSPAAPPVAPALPMDEPPFVNCEGTVVAREAGDFRIGAMGDLVFSGDTDANRRGLREAAALAEQSDFVFANLEGVITSHEVAAKPYVPGRSYAFRFPVATAGLLRDSGVHAVTIANNHSNDYGAQGFADSRQHLGAAGIGMTGQRDHVLYIERGGKRIALVAFGFYSRFNDINDIPAAVALVKRARAQVDLVVVTFHAGAEGAVAALLGDETELFMGERRGNPRAFSRAVIDAGADLVVGHGPHVLRAVECMGGKPVVHSLGNFVSAGGLNTRGLAGLTAYLEVVFSGEGGVRGLRLVPMTFSASRYPVVDGKEQSALRLVNRLADRGKGLVDFRPVRFPVAGDDGAFDRWLGQVTGWATEGSP